MDYRIRTANGEWRRSNDGWTDAVENGSLDAVRTLLSANTDLSNKPITRHRRDGSTFGVHPLQVATQRDDLTLARLLIESGADATGGAPEDCGFRMAPTAGPELIDLPIDHGTDLDLMHHNGTPLALAARRGDLEVMRHLVMRGADVNKAAPGTFETPLHRATFAPAEARGPEGPSEGKYTTVVWTLLESGADPNARTNIGVRSGMAPGLVLQGETPLHFAARCCGIEMVEILLEAGADPKIETALGETPRVYGEKFGQEDDVLGLLDW